MVMLDAEGGASSVVVGGANTETQLGDVGFSNFFGVKIG